MSVPLVARRPFLYAGQTVQEGQAFHAASDADANVLRTVGYAGDPDTDDVEPEPEPVKAPVRKRGRPRKTPVT